MKFPKFTNIFASKKGAKSKNHSGAVKNKPEYINNLTSFIESSNSTTTNNFTPKEFLEPYLREDFLGNLYDFEGATKITIKYWKGYRIAVITKEGGKILGLVGTNLNVNAGRAQNY